MGSTLSAKQQSPAKQRKQPAPTIDTISLSGDRVDLAQFRGKKVLVKFHRFSGCPVARRQVHDFINEQGTLNAAGIETIVVLHSSAAKMRPNFEEVAGLHLVPDPGKALYCAYHAEFRWRKLFSIGSWRATFTSFARGYFPQFTRFEGGIVGVPSDFLVDEEGTIAVTHHGAHFGDSWSASDALQAADVARETVRHKPNDG
jgi:peroxiredoxin